jgi:hypothetical protein
MHWTLDPRDNKDCVVIEKDSSRTSVSWQDAFKAFLAGKKTSSPWHSREVERRLKMGSSPQAVAEEIDMDPVLSGRPIFSVDKMAVGLESSSEPIVKLMVDTGMWGDARIGVGTRLWDMSEKMIQECSNGPIHVWEKPDPKVPYILFADPSENVRTKNDAASFAVANTITGKIAATGNGSWQPDEFAIVVCAMGYFYNECLLAVECNSVGMSVLMAITGRIALRPGEKTDAFEEEWLYRRIYTETVDDYIGERKSTRLGFRTGPSSRRKLITAQSRAIKHDVNFCKDRRYWSEAIGFVITDRGRIHNPHGDDLVIAVGGALFLSPDGRSFVPNKRRSLNGITGNPWKKALSLYHKRDFKRLAELSGVEVEVLNAAS